MRQLSIDILRTLAIFSMIQVHFVENLSAEFEGWAGLSGSGAAPVPWWLMTGLGAPLFTFLSGVSYRLWVTAQEARGRSDIEISKVTIRRGLFLFGLGLIFNIFIWLPEDIFNWDILTFTGSALMILNCIRRLPSSGTLSLCFVALVISPALRSIAGYSGYWEHHYFDYEFTLVDVLLGFITVGYFPVFPWIIFPLAGFLASPFIFQMSQTPCRVLAVPVVVGAALIALSAIGHLGSTYLTFLLPLELQTSRLTMFPASTHYVLAMIGCILIALYFCHQAADGSFRFLDNSSVSVCATTFSSHSLSIYLLHHIVHIYPLWFYGLITGNEPTAFWQNAMPSSMSLLLAIVFCVACFFLFRWLDLHGKPTAETAMRWICD